ncbi:hypothetical protein PVAND_006753 [Polypedilum vanderplanki]|uniref:Uncharacterized protein n=1 Tax=Polypedilum vanderplanki TaxID=319348 RepID=A0A9J6C533_POLVA|nr:hypothetical protein PVAND_006753 [Polypedilum vanderplanki]
MSVNENQAVIKSAAFMTPQEYMKIQLKKQQLAKRLKLRSSISDFGENDSKIPAFNDFDRQKRKANPFIKESEQESKKARNQDITISCDDTIFELIHNTKTKITPNLEEPSYNTNKLENNCKDFVHIEGNQNDDQEEKQIIAPVKVVPIDWSIKSRIRILSPTAIVVSNQKSNIEVSGLTSFVRCLDANNTTSSLDTSDGTRFHQHLMFWQYPHLPWLNLINRNASINAQYTMEEKMSEVLINDWRDNFKNIFQLLRARQCPYFYVLTNQQTILFRAAGIGGLVEMHAFVSPTTKGFRQLLTDEDIEFIQPLKKNSDNESSSSSSPQCNTVTTDNQIDLPNQKNETEVDDEMTFLETLGVNKSEIKLKEDVKKKQKELEDDNGELSTILIDGVDCQALIGFLINAKNTITRVGKLAGIPPTIISPVGFLGGTLRKQELKCNKLRMEGEDYYSVELAGALLPHTIQSITTFLSQVKENYTMSMTSYSNTIAFTKSSKRLMEDLDSSQAFADHVFGRENLSDCGISNEILESMCRVELDAVSILERLQFNKNKGGFTFF